MTLLVSFFSRSSARRTSSLLVLLVLTLLLLSLPGCSGTEKLKKDGLAYLRIGDPMPKAGLSQLAGRALSESLAEEGGYQWRVCTVQYADGLVLIESDFGTHCSVSRIRIETPELRVKRGVHVGMAWSKLISKSRRWIARPFPAYQVIELISRKYPRRVFLVRSPGFDFAQAPPIIDADALAADAQVVGIVLM
ncbi:MAG: hypothetical protein AAGN35_04335 [Bacteroidota bacterium]